MAKQITITIETDSMLILRGKSSRRTWCTECAGEQEMIALENAGVAFDLTQPAVEEWFHTGRIHGSQAPDGRSLICLKSLLGSVRILKRS